MNEIISSKKIMYRLLLAGFFLLTGYLSVMFFNKYDSHSYLKADNIVFSIVFMIISLGCLLIYMSVKDITITTTQLEFSSFLGYKSGSLRLSDITSYTLQIIPNKYGKNNEAITLHSKDGTSVKIKSNSYSNYDEMKDRLIHDVSRDENLEARLQYQNSQKSAIFIIVMGIAFLIVSFLAREKEIIPNDIRYVKDMAAENIEVIKNRKGRETALRIDLMKYPDYAFKISELGLDATDSERALSEIAPMDSIMIGIAKDDYDKKISKTIAPGFFDIYFGYSHIKVYALRNKNAEFLSIDNYNRVIKKDNFFGMGFFSLVGLMTVGLGIFVYFKAKWKASQTEG